jgi:hypothetical protein
VRGCLADEASTQHVLESIPIANFPLFIIQDEAGFRFLDSVGAAHAIAASLPLLSTVNLFCSLSCPSIALTLMGVTKWAGSGTSTSTTNTSPNSVD